MLSHIGPTNLRGGTHPDLATPLYISSDNAVLLDFDKQLRGTVSNGVSFNFLPLTLSLPEEGDDAGQTINVVLDGVTREITPLLRSTTTPASVRVQVVLASAPDNIEIEYPNFELVSADVQAGQVVLTLAVDVMSSEPFPADNFTPSTFGGLWSTT